MAPFLEGASSKATVGIQFAGTAGTNSYNEINLSGIDPAVCGGYTGKFYYHTNPWTNYWASPYTGDYNSGSAPASTHNYVSGQIY